MPTFPTYQRSVGLSGGPTGSPISADALAAPARALQNAGSAAYDLGDTIFAGEQRIRQTQDDTWLSKARAQTALDMITTEKQAQEAATDGASGYTDGIRSQFADYRQKMASQAPSPRAQRLYDDWANGYDVDLTDRSSRFQAQSELAKRSSDFTDAMNDHAKVVYADPSQYDQVYKRAMDDFQGAKQWMTPEEEVKAKGIVEKTLQLARAKSLVEYQPDQFLKEIGVSNSGNLTGDTAVEAVADKIIGVESGGNADAKNPNSSASGLGQFTDATWLETVRVHRPDIFAALPKEAILAMKNDRKVAREMTVDLTRDNAERLAGAGFSATEGNLYLAHFAGIGGAEKVLSSPDDKSVEAVLGSDVVKANPFLAGKNVGWLKNWAAEKMGSRRTPVNVPNNPRFSALSVDELSTLANSAQQLVNKQAASAYSSLKDGIDQGIATGQILSESQIVNSGLHGDDVATMLGKFRAAQAEGRNLGQAWQSFQNGTLSLDSYDNKDRTLVDRMDAQIPDSDPAMRKAWTNAIVQKTGIVPKGTISDIMRGLESRNVEDVASAAERAMKINQIDRSALAKRDNGGAAEKAAVAYDHYINDIGLTREQAAQRLMDMNDSEKVRARTALMDSKPIKDFVQSQATESNVRSMFDNSVFGLARNPALGDSAAESAAMVGEYRSILQESIFDAGGDTSAATKLAAQRFKRVYGTSVFTMSGDGVVTRLPPEKTCPPGPDGTFAYIGQQVKAALAAEGVKADDVFLKADDLTDADVRAGRPPRYEVFYRQNGNLERYMLPFYAVTPAKADVAPDLSQNRANRDDNLRFMQEERDRNRNMNIFTRADPMSAMVDLTGKRESGRLILGDLRPFNANEYIRNDDGSYSTERSVTIQDGKQWVNVPSLWRTQNGYVDFGNDDGAVRSAMRAFEKRSGDTFQRFDSLKEAERAAEARSKAGGAASE